MRRILAVKLADLGDLLTVSPALQALRAAHPGARIDLLTPPSSAGLLRDASYLDNIIPFDKFALDSPSSLFDPHAVFATLRFFASLRGAKYDALVLFHHMTTRWGALKFALLLMASGAPLRAGLDNGRGWFLTHRVSNRGFGARHEADYWLEVAALLGADPSHGWRPRMPVSERDREVAAQLFAGIRARHNGPLVAIHPGAGAYSPARIWPLERFAEVARALIMQENAAIIVLGGPDETERAADLVARIGGSERVLNLAGRTTIHETAAALETCDLFLGNDSGPMHVAAAMHTPVVAVFGPSNKEAWGPYTPAGEPTPHTVVSRNLPCQPCFYRGLTLGLREGCGPRPCLTRLGHEPVLEACISQLHKVYSTTGNGVM